MILLFWFQEFLYLLSINFIIYAVFVCFIIHVFTYNFCLFLQWYVAVLLRVIVVTLTVALFKHPNRYQISRFNLTDMYRNHYNQVCVNYGIYGMFVLELIVYWSDLKTTLLILWQKHSLAISIRLCIQVNNTWWLFCL